jgi:hypothetical protein
MLKLHEHMSEYRVTLCEQRIEKRTPLKRIGLMKKAKKAHPVSVQTSDGLDSS